jgi:hypothetical protein
MVQVRAHIRTGFEVSLLSDDSCSAKIWFSPSGTTYITFNNRTTPKRPALVVRQDAEYRKMNDFLNGDYNPKNGTWVIYSVTATVTGRFDHVSKAGLDAKVKIVTGFGHLNSYESQLVLESVSDVAAVPRHRLRISK